MKCIFFKNLGLKITGLIFLLLLAESLSAQDYSYSNGLRFEVTMNPGTFLYVDDDNTIGPWTGTELNPFENIPDGIDAATSGATVVVKPGNYLILQDLTVPADVVLFLFHGDTLRFGTTYSLNIVGRLQAFGKSNDSIYFTSSDSEGTWEGIHFTNSQLQSELRYCNLSNAVGTDGIMGGGIYILNSSVKIKGCQFHNNTANYGAAIYCDNNSMLDMDNCLISGNSANTSGGGLYGLSTDSLFIENSVFDHNIAASGGGALALKDSKAYLLQNDFIANEAGNGAAVHFDNVTADSAMFSWNTFKSNTATLNGGGLYVKSSNSISISRNLFIDNSSVLGGAVFFNNSSADYFNNTVISNTTTGLGGGLNSDGGSNNIFNNILWENFSSDGSQIAGSGITATYNNIEGGHPGTGNISAYPKFADTASCNFNLLYMSPCINTGDPSNHPDNDSTTIDIGVYYYHHKLPEISDQPEDAYVMSGGDCSFSLIANWALSFQWQLSSDEGVSWVDVSDSSIYSGFNSQSLFIVNTPLSLDAYKYRCLVYGGGTIPVSSDEVNLTVYPLIKTMAAHSNTCVGDILVPVNVANCNSVAAISLVLSYDVSKLTYNNYQNAHSDLSSGTLIVNANSGKIYISWASLTAANIGNDLLLELMFSSVSGSSSIIWDTIPSGYCEYSDNFGNVITSHYDNGFVTSNNCTTQIDVKVFLEGPYNGTEMNTGLDHLLPLSQPYNVSPWNYTGNETVLQMPSGSIVEWGLLELRETTGNASTATEATIIAQQAVYIRKDGMVKGLDGSNLPHFSEEISNNLYVIVRHRNHLSIMSANALSISGSAYTYDFTSGSEKVYGGALGHKQIGPGVWGMMSGDGNADDIININDKNDVWGIQAGKEGYLTGDYNLNKQVDNTDKNEGWEPNNGNETQVPD